MKARIAVHSRTNALRDRSHYPLFAKPIDGKYSLSIISADDYDAAADCVVLQGGAAIRPVALATVMTSREFGYVIQRRLAQHPNLIRLFGPRLWSIRVIVLVTPTGTLVRRAVAKIATGKNPADNFWRRGNMLGAINLAAGQIARVVQGTGVEMVIDGVNPDTGRPIPGTPIPDWESLTARVTKAARLLPGTRTQSCDIALTDAGPMPLEVNFGGDLNLAQLASGAGVLDTIYRAHLRCCGYRL